MQPHKLDTLEDGSLPPPDAVDNDHYYPACFRGASEIRRVTAEEDR